MNTWDAVVVGSGPNGLTAAAVLAENGCRVLVLEAEETIGGGTRTEEMTLPGFHHDLCSSVHPMALASPILGALGLEREGLEWIQPEAAAAHPLDGGSAVVLERSLHRTTDSLESDGAAYRALFEPLVEGFGSLIDEILGPPRIPQRPMLLARFGVNALRSADSLARSRFTGVRARTLVAGNAAHSLLPLERRPSAAIGLVLMAAAHAVGWPVPRGGARSIAGALARRVKKLGGEIRTGTRVRDLAELPDAGAILLDTSPLRLLDMGRALHGRGGEGKRFAMDPGAWTRFAHALERYRFGPGVFKVDWALSEPIPWRAPDCRRAATVHLGGSLDEIAESERAPWRGKIAERPFLILTQPSLFDPTRVPGGGQTAWAYCHVPNGFQGDLTERIERQVERFAPGFREVVLARRSLGPADLEARNENIVGGDINGGAAILSQILVRPVLQRVPYRTPIRGVYLCSASTPPGGGVHGMCGYHAARTALHEVFDQEERILGDGRR